MAARRRRVTLFGIAQKGERRIDRNCALKLRVGARQKRYSAYATGIKMRPRRKRKSAEIMALLINKASHNSCVSARAAFVKMREIEHGGGGSMLAAWRAMRASWLARKPITLCCSELFNHGGNASKLATIMLSQHQSYLA